jgi:four helix bundle protein
MATIKRFEDLECWQAARELTKYIYKLTKKDEFRRDFGLVNQIRESSVSSMGNTAEGFHRKSNKDFMRFLDYSRSSIAETISHSYVAYDQEYISEDELNEVKRLADIAWKKINNFITYLNKQVKNPKYKKKSKVPVTNQYNK